MRKRVLASIIVGGVCVAGAATAKPFDSMLVVGDSLSDPGNVFAITSALSDVFPVVEPTPASPPYFEGRFSNGPVWAEGLSSRLGLGGREVRNLALGGAETDGHTAIAEAPPLLRPLLEDIGIGGLESQVDTYLAAGGPISSNGLHVVWGGANDYLFDLPPETTPGAVPEPVSNIQGIITELGDAGAERFLVPNLPDLGRIPSTLDTPEASALTAVSDAHNAALAVALDETAAAEGLDIQLFNVRSFFDAAIEGAFGFANVTTPCIDAPATCDEALFFDGLHPTARAHDDLAALAHTVVTPVPASLTLMVPAVAALGWLGRRRLRPSAAADQPS